MSALKSVSDPRLKAAAATELHPVCVELASGVAALGDSWHYHAGEWIAKVRFMPDVAYKHLQERNLENRKAVPSSIAFISAGLRAGEYLLTGDTVKYDTDGLLRDGQNRLWSCYKTGIPLDTYVIVGVDRNVFKVLDQHGKRSLAAILGMLNESHCEVLSTILYALPVFFDTGVIRIGRTGAGRTPKTIEELLGGLGTYPNLRDSAAFAAKWRGGGKDALSKFQGRGLVAVAHWLFSMADEELAARFFDKALNETVGDEDEWYPLSKLGLTLQANQQKDRTLAPITTAAYTVQAWNACRDGGRFKKFHFPKGAAFPKISGWEYVQEDEDKATLPRTCGDWIVPEETNHDEAN